jgi:hypothetical protein
MKRYCDCVSGGFMTTHWSGQSSVVPLFPPVVCELYCTKLPGMLTFYTSTMHLREEKAVKVERKRSFSSLSHASQVHICWSQGKCFLSYCC